MCGAALALASASGERVDVGAAVVFAVALLVSVMLLLLLLMLRVVFAWLLSQVLAREFWICVCEVPVTRASAAGEAAE